MENEKELIWVSKEIAEEYKIIDSDETKEALMRKHISAKNLDIDEAEGNEH